MTQSSHQQIKHLEDKLLTRHAARDRQIAPLKRRIEAAERANARMQTDLTSALAKVTSKDAEIAKLQRRMAQDKKVCSPRRPGIERL